MESKELYILNSTCIVSNKAICDGLVVYEYDNNAKFSDFAKQLYKKLDGNYPKFYKMDNLSKLTFLAGELLVRKFAAGSNLPENTALIFANSMSTIDTDKNFVDTIDVVPSPAVFVYTLPNIALGELCIRYGWKGETLFLIQEQFNASQLVEQIAAAFSFANVSHCILGWADYFSDSNYIVHLWLISCNGAKKAQKLSEVGLLNDFNLHS
jgi:hypothetical protein